MVTNFILTFAYDPMGQRISKTKQVNTTVTKSYYFRDAQGQILQVMNSTVEADGTPQYSFEYPVYGSSRLGTKYPSISTTDFQYGFSPLVSYSNQVPLAPAINRRVINIKASVLVPIFTMVNHGTNMTQYELTNHLGNLAKINRGTRLDFANPERFRFGSNPTIKDEKEFYTVSMGSGITYTRSRPIVLTATVYYPFGMPIPGRTYSLASKTYRFGFNGKENENDLYGSGNAYDFGARIHDARIGRFLSVDPRFKEFPDFTLYGFAGNNPIQFIDEDGEGPNLASIGVSRAMQKILDWTYIKHKTGMNNVHTAEQARQNAIKQGRKDGDGITNYTKALVYIAGYWHALAPMSDANDGAVLAQGKNLDGSEAGAIDYSLAAGGIFIPFVSGSTVKSILKGFSKIDLKIEKALFNNAHDFYSYTKSLDVGERIAVFKKQADEIASANGWTFNKDLSKKNNGRQIYTDKDGLNYSLDTRLGRFEVTDSKGKHQGEVDFYGEKKSNADKTGKHNLKVK